MREAARPSPASMQSLLIPNTRWQGDGVTQAQTQPQASQREAGGGLVPALTLPQDEPKMARRCHQWNTAVGASPAPRQPKTRKLFYLSKHLAIDVRIIVQLNNVPKYEQIENTKATNRNNDKPEKQTKQAGRRKGSSKPAR